MTATDEALTTGTDDDHVSDWVYIKTAIWLGIFTAIEVFTYFGSVHNMPDWMLRLLLSVLMVVKFFMVAAIFMHLKYDNPVFTKFIVGGLVIAYPVYMLAAFMLGFLPNWEWPLKVILVAVPPIIAAGWLLLAWQGNNGDEQ